MLDFWSKKKNDAARATDGGMGASGASNISPATPSGASVAADVPGDVSVADKHAAEIAAANTPQALRESGTAALIELIEKAPVVYHVDHKFSQDIMIGNIKFNTSTYSISLGEGLHETFLFRVPTLQTDAVARALEIRFSGAPVDLSVAAPVAQKLRALDAEYRDRIAAAANSGDEGNDLTKRLFDEKNRRRIEIACEVMGQYIRHGK